jgi:hypothetical protein
MNINTLKKAESNFMFRYPGGFEHPEMIEIGKKHKVSKRVEQCQDFFSAVNFEKHSAIVENMTKVISQSSMVSMFEKPKFKSFSKALTALETDLLIEGLYQRLHDQQQQGFETIQDILATRKLAKWTLMSIIPVYYDPGFEVFVKPTTVKGIIEKLELKNLQYIPTPSWQFYETFREQINQMKEKVDPSLSPNNAAFTGFLMMSLQHDLGSRF